MPTKDRPSVLKMANASVGMPQILTEESPSASQPYFGSASYHLTSKYSPNKKAQKEHVKSCHLDEENFYMKEIDKLKNELDNLKHVEKRIMYNDGTGSTIVSIPKEVEDDDS